MFEEGGTFVDVLLWVVYLLLVVVTVVAVWSAVHQLRTNEKTKEPTRGVPARFVAYGVAGLFVVTMLLSFLLGSSKPMLINNQWFKDVIWLKMTDMFMWTSLVLLIIAALGVLVGSSGMIRKVKK